MTKPGLTLNTLNPLSVVNHHMEATHHLHTNSHQEIIKMANTITTRLFTNPTNILISNIVAIIDQMGGKIKSIVKTS